MGPVHNVRTSPDWVEVLVPVPIRGGNWFELLWLAVNEPRGLPNRRQKGRCALVERTQVREWQAAGWLDCYIMVCPMTDATQGGTPPQ